MPDPRIHGIPEPGDLPGSGSPDNSSREVPDEASPSDAEGGLRPASDGDTPSGTASDVDALIPDPDAPTGSGTRENGAGASGAEVPGAEVVDIDVEALSAKAAKADEYLDLAQRTKAEFDNYRKRTARDAALAQERGALKLAKELLPAIDNLDRALAHADATEENGDGSLIAGIRHVHTDLISALKRADIEPYSPEGEPFDPQYHEAVAQQPIEGTEPGTVVEVYQRGYRRGENVLRPARVVVAG